MINTVHVHIAIVLCILVVSAIVIIKDYSKLRHDAEARSVLTRRLGLMLVAAPALLLGFSELATLTSSECAKQSLSIMHIILGTVAVIVSMDQWDTRAKTTATLMVVWGVSLGLGNSLFFFTECAKKKINYRSIANICLGLTSATTGAVSAAYS